MSITSPFPHGRTYKDQQTDALIEDGVCYTNATEKGPILDRFMNALLFKSKVDPKRLAAGSRPIGIPTASSLASGSSSSSSGAALPHSVPVPSAHIPASPLRSGI